MPRPSFFDNSDVEVPTTTLYMADVVSSVRCDQHDAPRGKHCYVYPSLHSDREHHGICDARARRAGLNAPIRSRSLRPTEGGYSDATNRR